MTIARRMKLFRRLVRAGFVGHAVLVLAYFSAGRFPSPVQGVHGIGPSFHAPRQGMLHQGIDVFAKRGTNVRSVGWGIVAGIEAQRMGGKVVHVVGRGGMLAFYAHLDDWAPGLHVGQIVEEGDVLGVVGDTGNAKGTPPHLHFELRPAFTIFAPVDPLLFVEHDSSARDRLDAAIRSLPERR